MRKAFVESVIKPMERGNVNADKGKK